MYFRKKICRPRRVRATSVSGAARAKRMLFSSSSGVWIGNFGRLTRDQVHWIKISQSKSCAMRHDVLYALANNLKNFVRHRAPFGLAFEMN